LINAPFAAADYESNASYSRLETGSGSGLRRRSYVVLLLSETLSPRHWVWRVMIDALRSTR